jgi:hypothetical protein
MEVHYSLTADDLFAFQWRAAYESADRRRASRKVHFTLFLTLLLIALLPGIGADGFVVARVNVLFVAVVFPVVSGLYWWLERSHMRRAIAALVRREQPDKGQLGSHRVVLTDEGVVEATAVSESKTSWAGIDRVEQNGDYIFIYTAPGMAHVIPKRAFTGGLAEQFYQLARTRRAQADSAASGPIPAPL